MGNKSRDSREVANAAIVIHDPVSSHCTFTNSSLYQRQWETVAYCVTYWQADVCLSLSHLTITVTWSLVLTNWSNQQNIEPIVAVFRVFVDIVSISNIWHRPISSHSTAEGLRMTKVIVSNWLNQRPHGRLDGGARLPAVGCRHLKLYRYRPIYMQCLQSAVEALSSANTFIHRPVL